MGKGNENKQQKSCKDCERLKHDIGNYRFGNAALLSVALALLAMCGLLGKCAFDNNCKYEECNTKLIISENVKSKGDTYNFYGYVSDPGSVNPDLKNSKLQLKGIGNTGTARGDKK